MQGVMRSKKMKKMIEISLNGMKREVEVEPTDILLDVLRDRLGVKSPKFGCGRGDCGSCTIFMNGRSVRSCIILAVEADGADIQTLEGIPEEKLHNLQESFIKHSSFQCGFCTPGMVLSAVELLEKNPLPSEEEIKAALAGNLCRCTGYTPIIDAVVDASKRRQRRKT